MVCSPQVLQQVKKPAVLEQQIKEEHYLYHPVLHHTEYIAGKLPIERKLHEGENERIQCEHGGQGFPKFSDPVKWQQISNNKIMRRQHVKTKKEKKKKRKEKEKKTYIFIWN